MKRLILFFVVCLYSVSLFAQPSKDHPLYWKNRKPHAAYWQQDVHYKIDAYINEQEHTIVSHQNLTYLNNSPDTLYEIYFHLFQNAFVKDAYTRSLEEANKVKARLGKREAAGLGTIIDSLSVDGQAVNVELDNTILRVNLNQPLLPGTATQIYMYSTTYYDMGGTRRRMKMYPAWGFMHYNGCQWFPKVAVYDAKFGWDTHQHLGKEFYGDFGTYDVTLDFPSNYIVEATGALQNRKEMLPDTLRQKLDLKNFANKPWGEPPSTIIPYKKGERKRWHFVAELVHDFAFTADPSYRIGTTYWNGVECIGLAQEPHASGWQNSPQYVADIIKTFSEHYGQYAYPKMIAADAADGMEYPMLTLDGGRDPGYRGLLVHEIAHNWFYGMVGNNETYRAALDEGFTQFLTADGLEKIDGPYLVEDLPKNKWQRSFYEPKLARDARVFNGYYSIVQNGLDYPLNTHSDDFRGALGHGGGYGQVYYKTAVMLYNLQYVLGDSLFNKAMQHYFNQWKFAHPYMEDMRNSFIQFTKVDLNWFFDQWLETTKTVDYKIKCVKRISHTDSFALTIQRKGSMQMPLDIVVWDKLGNPTQYYIPNTWFEKQTDAEILPRWIGWGNVKPEYTARIHAPNGVKKVMIDDSYRLADVNRMNNTKTKGALISKEKLKVNFDGGIAPPYDWRKYRLQIRPDIWYNALDGVKLGVVFDGSFKREYYQLQAGIWANTTLGRWNQFDRTGKGDKWYNYRIKWKSPLTKIHTPLFYELESRFIDGLWWHQANLQWSWQQHAFQIGVKSMYRDNVGALDYLLDPMEWSSVEKQHNTSLFVKYGHTYQGLKTRGNVQAKVSAPLTSAFDYSYVDFTWNHNWRLDKLMISSRVFGRLGMGERLPSESLLYLAGANPEEMMENKYVRSQAFIPNAWNGHNDFDYRHFHYGGGLNMRAYTGYYATDFRDGENLVAYKGRSGAAINLQVEFQDYFNWQPAAFKNWLSVKMYAFADAGIMELSRYSSATPTEPAKYYSIRPANMLSDIRVDAGIGTVWTIKKWYVFDKAKPLSVRFDMPLFNNIATYGTPQHWMPRWILGIGTAF